MTNSWGDFDVTGRGVYYLSPTPHSQVMFYSFSTNSATPLLALEKRPGFGLTAAQDDSSVLFTQFDTEASELVLIENFH